MKARAIVRFLFAFSFFAPTAVFASDEHLLPGSEGTIIVEQEDYFDPSSPPKLKHSVVVKNSRGELEHVPIEQPDKTARIPRGLKTGDRVKLHGHKRKKPDGKNVIVLEADPVGSNSGASIELLAAAPAVAAGPRNVLAVVVDFNDSTMHCSDAELETILFTGAQSVRAVYNLSSYGKINVVRDSNFDGRADIYHARINHSAGSATCDYYSWMSAANNALISQGVNLNLYNRRVYYLGNGASACLWAGLGTIGQGWALVNGQHCALGNGDTAVHELGHNETLGHASIDQDNNGVSEGDYEDLSCPMGYAGVGPRQFNAPHKIQLGWLPAANITNVNATQSLRLSGLDANVSATQAAMLPRAASGGGSYYLSFRIDDGVLQGLPLEYKNVTNIHWKNTGSAAHFVRTLNDGQSFTDRTSGMTVTQHSHTGSYSDLSVNFKRAQKTVQDFDNDLKTDMVLQHEATGTWYIIDSSTGQARQPIQWGYAGAKPVKGDYDGDGKADFVLQHESSGTWYIIESSTNKFRQFQWGYAGAKPAPGDYDGDGKTDFALQNEASGRWYIIDSSTGISRQPFQWGYAGAKPVAADYDGDGRTDFVLQHEATGTWHIIDSSTNKYREFKWGYAGAKPVVGDFDRDGKTDYALQYEATGRWYIIDSSTGQARQPFHWGYAGAKPVLGDYDGDGKTDLALQHESTGTWHFIDSSTSKYRTQQWGYGGARPPIVVD